MESTPSTIKSMESSSNTIKSMSPYQKDVFAKKTWPDEYKFILWIINGIRNKQGIKNTKSITKFKNIKHENFNWMSEVDFNKAKTYSDTLSLNVKHELSLYDYSRDDITTADVFQQAILYILYAKLGYRFVTRNHKKGPTLFHVE